MWMIEDDIENWYVVFWKRNPLDATWRDKIWWKDFWAIGGYRHVSCFGYSPSSECWVHFNPDPARNFICVAPNGDRANDMIETLLLCGSVVKVPAKAGRMGFLKPMNCVSMVKHMIGARCGALMPAGLRTYLLRNGGSEVANVRWKSDYSASSI